MIINISNETIKKLNADELNDLGVFSNAGIILVNGTPKTRVKASAGYWKGATNAADDEVSYTLEGAPYRYELVKHAGGGYAFRTFNTETNQYIEVYSPLAALPFMK